MGLVDAVILCGGMGTRLQSIVSDYPKALAPIAGRPFLDILLERLYGHGLRRIILCVGHLKEHIKRHVAASTHSAVSEILFSEEEELLGTGGGLKRAECLLQSESVFVMNGDTFCKVDFSELYQFHCERRAALSMVLVKNEGGDDGEYGSVVVGEEQRITGFREKNSIGEAALRSAGIYLMQKGIFSRMEDGNFSLENDFFPHMVADGDCYGFITDGTFIDIGTPERYELANQIFSDAGGL